LQSMAARSGALPDSLRLVAAVGLEPTTYGL
jgi:hypothetical protein